MVFMDKVRRMYPRGSVPMPSPRGTNSERLFLSGPVALAYDSADGLGEYARHGAMFGAGFEQGRRLARDQESARYEGSPEAAQARGSSPDEGIAKLKLFLRNRLDPQSYA